MATIRRTATAQWRGAGRDGNGMLSTQSGTLSDTPYSFTTRFATARAPTPRN